MINKSDNDKKLRLIHFLNTEDYTFSIVDHDYYNGFSLFKGEERIGLIGFSKNHLTFHIPRIIYKNMESKELYTLTFFKLLENFIIKKRNDE